MTQLCACEERRGTLPWVMDEHTSQGTKRLYDAGHRVTPVEWAELSGLQTAIANAFNRETRRSAEKALVQYLTRLHAHHFGHLPKDFRASTHFGVVSDGRYLVGAQELPDPVEEPPDAMMRRLNAPQLPGLDEVDG